MFYLSQRPFLYSAFNMSLKVFAPPIPSVQAYVACSRLQRSYVQRQWKRMRKTCGGLRREEASPLSPDHEARPVLHSVFFCFVLFCFFLRGAYYLRAWHRFHRAVDKRTLFQILSSLIVGDGENQATLFLLCATANDNRLNWRIVASVYSMVTFSSAS